MTRRLRSFPVWLAPLALAVACGSSDENALDGKTSGAGAGDSTTSAETSGDLTGSTGSGSDDFTACASAKVMGRSGSMLQDQKWAQATTALIAFFQDPESAGLSVALRFFPDDKPTAGCSAPACNVAACAEPLVPVGTLNAQPAYSDPQQKALVEAVNSVMPEGQTPMYAALGGAEMWAKADATPEHRTAVVLITDGEPQGCDENLANIAALAADAKSSKGVLTYAIGMSGANQSQLNQIAAAGGSELAFMINQGTVTTELRAALKKVKTSQLACTFEVPPSADPTKPVDPALINVTLTKGGSSPSVLPQVSGPGACVGAAWHYDDPGAPKQLVLCPDVCKAAQGDPSAVVEVVIGCATVVL